MNQQRFTEAWKNAANAFAHFCAVAEQELPGDHPTAPAAAVLAWIEEQTHNFLATTYNNAKVESKTEGK